MPNNNLNFGVDVLPTASNAYNLGLTDKRWNIYANELSTNSLEFGTTSTVGDKYTPIYWNNGAPTTAAPIIKVPFTISTSNIGVSLASTAFTAGSYVSEIVIDTGFSYLNSPISTSSINGNITLSTNIAVSGTVSGYILVSRGVSITPTMTQLNT